jgi:hypothetical protein
MKLPVFEITAGTNDEPSSGWSFRSLGGIVFRFQAANINLSDLALAMFGRDESHDARTKERES